MLHQCITSSKHAGFLLSETVRVTRTLLAQAAAVEHVLASVNAQKYTSNKRLCPASELRRSERITAGACYKAMAPAEDATVVEAARLSAAATAAAAVEVRWQSKGL